MKIYLSYEMFKNLCLAMAEEIITGITGIEHDCIVPIMRGGMSAAHIIAKELNLPTGAYWPKEKMLSLPPNCSKPVFVEDLVAKGRTYLGLMEYLYRKNLKFTYAPVLIDGNNKMFGEDTFPVYGMITKHWIVFPYEDFNKMNEGDRGLFREGTDTYGK